jgi:hypothetical protein
MMMTAQYKKLGLLSALMFFTFGTNTASAADEYRYVYHNMNTGSRLPMAGGTPSEVNTTGASASIPPVSQRAAQYNRETVDATMNRTSANTEIGRTINGQFVMQSPSGPIPIDGKTRAFTPDNAYLEQRPAIIRVK